MKKVNMFKLMIISTIVLLSLTACSVQTAEDSFNLYKKALEDKDYEAMYSMISKESKDSIEKEEFLERYKNIYGGIRAENIELDIEKNGGNDKDIEFTLNMDTIAGPLSIEDYKAKMVKEEQGDKKAWFIDWDESLIFPGMEKEDKVGIEILPAKRGAIYDKDGEALAINGKRYSLGIYPALYKEASNKELADLLDIDEKIISNNLEKNTDPEQFVPIVKIALEDKERLYRTLAIEGIQYYEVEDRVYPGGEALGSLVGYIKAITAEELEEDKEGIYQDTSLVGKAGLETVYEETLRAKDGREIYISKIKDGEEAERIVLAKTEAKDGEDLNTTIDTKLQKKIYEEMDGDTGAASAMDPETGKVLAMVSSPSFDSNIYTTYTSNAQRKEWEEMDESVFVNRFNKAYSPGSTFKIITSAIGLDRGKIDPLEKLNIAGKSWQKDNSWGNYKINRVSQNLSKVDFNDALVYSDNIYFAQMALKIGEKDFLEKSKKFGFGEALPIEYPFANSQIISGEKMANEILLADTGYGQGEVLMSPLHLSLVYSSLVNDGNIMEPVLEKDKSETPNIWKENVIEDKNREILLKGLINVIEDKNGTGHEAKLPDIKLAGKTGTAELKSSQGESGKENGWFVAMDIDEPKVVISMMIEGVEDRGGSHYLVPKVKNIIEDYLKNK